MQILKACDHLLEIGSWRIGWRPAYFSGNVESCMNSLKVQSSHLKGKEKVEKDAGMYLMVEKSK